MNKQEFWQETQRPKKRKKKKIKSIYQKFLDKHPSSLRPYLFSSAAISFPLFTRNHDEKCDEITRDWLTRTNWPTGRREDFSSGRQIIENKIFFIYSFYGNVPLLWTRLRSKLGRANFGKWCAARCAVDRTGKRYRCSYFFADCGCSFVEATICAIFVSRFPRLPRRWLLGTQAVSIRLYNGLHHRRACIDPISIQRHLIRFATHR